MQRAMASKKDIDSPSQSERVWRGSSIVTNDILTPGSMPVVGSVMTVYPECTRGGDA